MARTTRREFLGEVGGGMFVASLGPALAFDLGLSGELAGDDELTFGELEPLVRRMQETSLDKLMPALVAELRSGTSLKTLVAAGSLANARVFAGEDYQGYHCMMALVPALAMSRRLPARQAALPVLKVLFRNTARIHAVGGRSKEKLENVEPAVFERGRDLPKALERAVYRPDMEAAEKTFAAITDNDDAFADLQSLVRGDINVHRIVLAWRAWDMRTLVGARFARVLLREAVRFCVDQERIRISHNRPVPRIRSVLPKLLDDHGLLTKTPGNETGSDAWVDELSTVIWKSSREDAGEAVAKALASGYSPDSVCEAISLAATQLLLNDRGRDDGAVHGASVGVHASDAANAWRHVARVGDHKHLMATLVAAAYHTAGQSSRVGKSPFHETKAVDVETTDATRLLAGVGAAVEANDQAKAAAYAERYGKLGHAARPMFDLLLETATSADGALHAEKYYNTVLEEYQATRSAFRWRHVVALARVSASESGTPAPGLQQARKLLHA